MSRPAAIAIAIVAVIAIAGLATYIAYNPLQPSSGSFAAGAGTLNIYMIDAPPSGSTLKSLLLNVTSVALSYEGNVTTTAPRNQFVFQVPSSRGMNVDLLTLRGTSLLLGAPSVPAGNVTRIILNITGAKAFFTDGTSAQLNVVAGGKLMIPFHFQVMNGGSVDLTIDIQPNEIHVSQGVASVLTPVVHAMAVQKSHSATITAST
jgi:hypothetical protein